MGNVWSVIEDGYATGPKRTVESAGQVIEVLAVWTNEDGVCVSVDTGDEPLPARVVHKVCAAIMELAALPAPERSSI